jgi:hypothetical protein
MKKIAQNTLFSLLALGAVECALALDSGAQNLTTTVGATDYFKINCSGDTDHLNFKLLENAVAQTPIETKPDTTQPEIPVELPQLLNANLTKGKLSASISKLVAGSSKEISLKGGLGAYSLKMDTIGTNLALKKSQTYTIAHECLDSAGKVLSKSLTTPNYTLANGRTRTFRLSCAKKGSSSLKVKITNKTAVTKTKSAAQVVEVASSGNLAAQIIKGAKALNTVGDVLDLKGGNGNYFVMVNSAINAAKNYRFEYSCLNASNKNAKTALIEVLQDQ